MKVTEYFLGFGPRLWSIRRGETEYGVKAIPPGGYVKILGMTNLEEVDPGRAAHLPPAALPQARLLVAVAGSAMHFVMAFVLLLAMLAFVGRAERNRCRSGRQRRRRARPSPAQAAGLEPGDGSSRSTATGERQRRPLITAIEDHAGQPSPLVVDRDGQRPDPDGRPRRRAHRARGRSGAAAGARRPYGVDRGGPRSTTADPAPAGAVGSPARLGHVDGARRAASASSSRRRRGHASHQVTNAQAANQAASQRHPGRVDPRGRADGDRRRPRRDRRAVVRARRHQHLHRDAQPLPDAPPRRRPRGDRRLRADPHRRGRSLPRRRGQADAGRLPSSCSSASCSCLGRSTWTSPTRWPTPSCRPAGSRPVGAAEPAPVPAGMEAMETVVHQTARRAAARPARSTSGTCRWVAAHRSRCSR